MSTVVMSACWPLQMPPTQKAVLISLADNANDNGECWPSIPKICLRTCFSERAVHGAIKWLESHGLVKADRSNGRHTRYVIHTEGYEPPQEMHPRSKCGGAGDAAKPPQEMQSPPQQLQSPPQQLRSNHQEPSRTISKSNHQGKSVDLPEWLSQETWANWVAYRKKTRRPLTDRAVTLSINELDALRAKGFTPEKVIDNAIVMGWRGLYEPRSQAPPSKPSIAQQFAAKTYQGTPDDELPDYLRA